MHCFNCRWVGDCEGAACYYDEIREQRESSPGYDDKKFYLVDQVNWCAYSGRMYSQREVDDHRDEVPYDDINGFYTAEEIAQKPDIKWDTDDIWYQRGQEEARGIYSDQFAKVFERWKGLDRNMLSFKRELGFFDELMKMAEEAGLK